MHGPVFVGTQIPDMVLFGGKTDAKLNFGLNDIYMQIGQGKIFKAAILAGQDQEGLINCH